MTESDAAPERGQRAKLLAGSVSCIVGLLLAIGQVLAAFLGAGDNITAGALGIGFCILGYYLDSRKLATAIVLLCVAAILFGMVTS
jgi:1,4-dihydroxy-2-naphthoate octaprenyltransferase